MTPTLLILVPPFALIVWRQDTPSVLALLGAMALCACLDWRRSGASGWSDFAGSVNGTLARHDAEAKALRDDLGLLSARLDTIDGRTLPLAANVKELKESVERHATQLATHGQRKAVL